MTGGLTTGAAVGRAVPRGPRDYFPPPPGRPDIGADVADLQASVLMLWRSMDAHQRLLGQAAEAIRKVGQAAGVIEPPKPTPKPLRDIPPDWSVLWPPTTD